MSEEAFNVPHKDRLPARIRAVFFDAGNTLAYLDVAWIARRLHDDGWDVDEEALTHAFNVTAYEVSRMVLLKKYSTDADRIIPYLRRILELAGIPADFTGECAEILALEHKDSFLWRAVPDYVIRTLEELHRRGYVLGCISNSDGRLKPLFDRTGLSPHLKFIIDSAVVGVEKPDPQIFRLAVRTAEMSADRCLYVGDIYAVDMEGARRAGITGVLLDPLFLHGEFDCIRIGRLSDLLDLLPPVRGFEGKDSGT